MVFRVGIRRSAPCERGKIGMLLPLFSVTYGQAGAWMLRMLRVLQGLKLILKPLWRCVEDDTMVINHKRISTPRKETFEWEKI
jgi:hypothetical protein